MPKHRPPGRSAGNTPPETGGPSASSARIAWFATLGARTERDRPARPISLPPPDHVRAVHGRDQVTIEWSPVQGAAGYLVHRGPAANGPFEPIDQGGGDVLAVPHGPYLDTTRPPRTKAWYAVSSLPTIEAEGGALSQPVAPRAGPSDAAVAIRLDAGHVLGASWSSRSCHRVAFLRVIERLPRGRMSVRAAPGTAAVGRRGRHTLRPTSRGSRAASRPSLWACTTPARP
jgi:hypothetical protein